MERGKELNQKQRISNLIIEQINDFYQGDRLNKDGVVFSKGEEINRSRIRLLIEDFIMNNWTYLNYSDKNFLLDKIFITNFKDFITQKIVSLLIERKINKNNLDDIQEVLNRINQLSLSQEQAKISLTLHNTLKESKNTSFKQAIKENLIKEVGFNLKYTIKQKWLVQSTNGNHYWIDLENKKNSKLLWKSLEKSYTISDLKAGDLKVFIFKEEKEISLDQLGKILENFSIISNNDDILSFLAYLEERLNITFNQKIKVFFQEKINSKSILAIQKSQLKFPFLIHIRDEINSDDVAKGKHIYLVDKNGNLSNQWVWKSYKNPPKVENIYEDQRWMRLYVKDRENKKHIILSDGLRHNKIELPE